MPQKNSDQEDRELTEQEILEQSKKLVVAIRKNFPDAVNAITRVTWLNQRKTYVIQIDGVPPTDWVTVKENENVLGQFRNWGADEIESIT